MKKSILLKQPKPLIAKILGGFILLLLLFMLYEGAAKFDQIVILVSISMVLLGYSISFEIQEDFNPQKHFKLFGLTVFKQRLNCIYPDYITVFYALFKKDSEWGPVAAMGSQTKEGNYVVRFFKGNKYFTIWKSSSLELANAKAYEIGELINVEVKLKN